MNIEDKTETTAQGSDAYATYDSQGNLIVGKDNQVSPIQKDPKTGNARVDSKPENVVLGTRNGVGKFTHSTEVAALANQSGSSIHDYGVNSMDTTTDTNYNNAGAVGNNALAAGVSAGAKRTDAVAIGTKAAANGERSIAIGSGAHTKDEDAQKDNIAIGTNAYAGGDSSVVIGNGAQTDDQKQRAVVLGKEAKGKGNDTLAAGTGAQAEGDYAIALGTGASAKSDGTASVAIGYSAKSVKESTAVGPEAETKGNESVAIGHKAVTSSQYSVAIGPEAVTGSNDTATAIGYKANANNQYATALGAKAQAKNNYGVALGTNSVEQGATENDNVKFITINGVQHNFSNAVSQYAVSVGDTTNGNTFTRQIKSVANGEVSATSTDAINGSQLYAVAQAITNSGGGGSSIHDYSVNSVNPTGDSNYTNGGATGNNALAAGVNAKATGANATAVGNGAKAAGADSIALGTNAQADGIGAVVIGEHNMASGQNALAFGGAYYKENKGNTASGIASVAFGEGTQAIAEGTLAFGENTQAGSTEKDNKGNPLGQNAVAFGNGTKATGGRSLAFGERTVASANDATAFGNESVASNTGATAFGNKNRATGMYATAWGGGDNVVDGTKTGTIASGTYATAFGERTEASGESATAFGSDSTASGKNSLAFGEKSTAAAENSLAALGGTVDASAANAAAIGKGAQANLADTVALGSGSVADRASGAKGYDAATGKETTETSAAWVSKANGIAVGNGSTLTRQITGVAAGSQDTDAVNLAQLKKVGELAGKHTTVSVGGKSATADNTEVKGGNLELTRKTTNGQANYDVALSKDVVLGEQEEHKGGSLVVNSVAQFRKEPGSSETVPVKEAVKIDGTTVSVVKNDGTNDQRQVVLGIGQDTGGYVALYDNTGKKPTYIFNAISSGITYLDGNNKFGRLEYGDIYNGSTQFIATLDDGLKFSGDQGTASAVKLNQKLSVTGGETNPDNLATANNIGVVSSQDGDNGKLELKLNKDLTGLNTVTAGTAKIGHHADGVLDTVQNGQPTGVHAKGGEFVTGLTNKEWTVKDPTYVSGRAATEDELRIVSDEVSGNTTNIKNNKNQITNNTDTIAKGLSFTTNTKDASNTGENYKGYKVVKRSLGDTIAIKASDEADNHSYNTANLTTRIAENGDISILMDEKPTFTTVTTGDVIYTGNPDKKDNNGKAAQADTSVHYGDKTLTDGKNITTSDNETKSTRLGYQDAQGLRHDLATLDDGQIYAGDIKTDGTLDNTGFARTMNQKTTINGGVTEKDKLTDGNIGVVSNGTDTLTVKLAKDLKNLNSVTTGKTVQNDSGITITNDKTDETKNVVINRDKISFGGNQVTNMGSGINKVTNQYDITTNGANIGDVKNIANSTTEAAKLTGDSNITVTYNDHTAGGKNTVKLNDSITLGSDAGKKVTIDGTKGTITAGDKVSFDGSNGKGSIGGVTIGNQTGVATTKKDGDTTKTEDGTFVTGLTNTNWNPDANGIVSGRAATEDQLKTVSDTVNAGWELDVNDGKQKDVTPTSKKVNFKEGQNITITGSGDDVTVATGDNVRFTTINVTGDKDASGSYTGGITIGKQSGGASANPGPGYYITGLQNTTWNSSQIQSGRAATEDQLKQVAEDIQQGTVAGDKYITGGNATYGENGKGSATLTGTNGLEGTISNLHDYYVTRGEVSDDGKKLTMTKNDGTTFDVDLDKVMQSDMRLVKNPASKDGKYTVDNNGDLTLTVQDANGTEATKQTITLSGLASKEEMDKGLNFAANSGDPYNAKLGNTVTIKGVAAKDGHVYSEDNLTTEVDADGNITIKMDKDLTANTVTVSGKDGKDGQIGITGKDGADGTVTTIIKTIGKNGTDGKNGTPGVNGTDGITRIVYQDGEAGTTTHTVATLDDGLKFGANTPVAGKTANPVGNKLNSTINIKGAGTKELDKYSGQNLLTSVEQADDGTTTINVLMDKNISADSVVVGQEGKAGKDGKDGYIGINGKDGADGITTTLIRTEKGQPGADGKNGKPGVDGTDITRIVYQNGQDGTDGKDTHTVATLDDGLKFAGDDGQNDDTKVINKKLNERLDIVGKAQGELTDANIGVTKDDNGKLYIRLAKHVNLDDGTLQAGDAKIGKFTNTELTTNKGNHPVDGSYTIGLDNKDWNVDSPDYVSGRAATEDQLAKVSEAITNATTAAGKRTVVTVNDKSKPTVANPGTNAYGEYDTDNGNLMIAAERDSDGLMTYNIKLNDQLAIGKNGTDGQAGKDGKDGKVTVETKGGTTVVVGHNGADGDNGKDGLFVTGKDGKDGKSGVSITGPNGATGADGVDGKVGIAGKDGNDAVSISGKDGIGHIGLTGQKGADGKDGVFSDLSTILGTATLDPAKNEQSKSKDTVSADDKSSRIQYQTTVTDKDGKTKTVITHEVATMDDGMKYAGNFGDSASVKLNKTVTIKGKVKDDAKKDDFVDGNIAVVANKSQNGEDAELLIKLNKDLTGLNSATYTTSTKNGDVTTTSTTVVDGTGLKIDNGPSITNTGIDGGKHQITNVASGKNGHMYDTTVTGQENWNNAASIGDVTNIAKSAADGVKAKSGKNITVDTNNKVNLNDNITLGDDKDKAKQVSIDGNGAKITAGDGDNKVTVDGSKGQIVAGGDNGVKIGKIADGDGSLTIYDKDGKATGKTDKAGKYVTNLDNKTWNKDGSYVSGRAATEDQLHQVESNVNKQIADVNTKIDTVDKHHTEVTVNGGTAAKADGSYTDGNLQIAQKTGADGQKVYDLKLNDNLNIGGVGKDGKDGKDGHVGINGKDGKSGVGIDGKDGISVKGKDGQNGVTIKGVDGKDGTEGHIGLVGPKGPKGADGKDGQKASADIHVKNGQVGVDGTDGHGGKNGMDRVVYEDHNGTSHEVATMDDGMKYSGDSGNAAVKLNNNVQLYGGAKEYAAGDNIGVVVSQDGDNAKMQVKLAKDLKGIDSIDAKTVTTGNTTINNSGMTVKGDDNHKDITIQQGDVNMGGNKIEGVAPGKVAPDSTEAINGSQLAQRDQAIGKLGGEVSSLDRRVDRVGAGAAALAALHPQDFDPDDKWDFAVGYGNYRGANAAAVGAFYRPNEDTTLSVGGTVGGGENMVNAGISFKFGQGNHVTNSRVAMAKEILALKDYVQKQDEKIEKLEALVGQQGTAAAPKRRSILFPDVPENHWAYVYVKKLADRGLLEGYPDGEFKGDRTITRYEFAAIFSRALENGASVDGDMERMSEEFEPEIRELSLNRFRVDRVEGKDNDRHKIERVRVNDRDELVKQKNGEQKKRYRDVYGSVIEKDAPADAAK